jgi:hypothetical protein
MRFIVLLQAEALNQSICPSIIDQRPRSFVSINSLVGSSTCGQTPANFRSESSGIYGCIYNSLASIRQQMRAGYSRCSSTPKRRKSTRCISSYKPLPFKLKVIYLVSVSCSLFPRKTQLDGYAVDSRACIQHKSSCLMRRGLCEDPGAVKFND